MRNRLAKVSMNGFKTIKNLPDFEPGSLSVPIGPNGAGKSNFISFFRLLSWALAAPGNLQLHVSSLGELDRVVRNAKAYYANPQAFDEAWKVN